MAEAGQAGEEINLGHHKLYCPSTQGSDSKKTAPSGKVGHLGGHHVVMDKSHFQE